MPLRFQGVRNCSSNRLGEYRDRNPYSTTERQEKYSKKKNATILS